MITIPLQGGAVNAHQAFFVQLGENFLEFRLNYITRFPGWSLDILREGEVLMYGVMLVPGQEITANYAADIGQLIFTGDDTTIDNLGIDNDLVWIDG